MNLKQYSGLCLEEKNYKIIECNRLMLIWFCKIWKLHFSFKIIKENKQNFNSCCKNSTDFSS